MIVSCFLIAPVATTGLAKLEDAMIRLERMMKRGYVAGTGLLLSISSDAMSLLGATLDSDSG